MTVRIVLASANPGKLAELRKILGMPGVELLSLNDFPDLRPVAETGTTFRENALLKAREVARQTGEIALADDSGLEVDYLGGRPGVHSARYAGEPADDRRNNEKLLRELQGVPPEKRTARFRCVLALVFPDGREYITEGTLEGRIGEYPRGSAGFGYDSLFIEAATGKTLAEISPELKNQISHRAKALQAIKEILEAVVPGKGGRNADRSAQ